MGKIQKWIKTWFRVDPQKPQFSVILRFSIWFLLLMGIPLIFRFYKVWYNFDIRITETGDLLYYQFSLRDTLDIILTGIIFPVIAWKLYKSLDIELLIKSKSIENMEIPSISVSDFRNEQNSNNPWSITFFVALLIYSMGVIDHVILNNIHSKIGEDQYGSLLFTESYFWDEYMGHLLIGIALYIMITILWLRATELKPFQNFKKFQTLFLILIGLGSGAGVALSFSEGQCAIILAFLNIIFLILLVYLNIKKEIKILKNPFQLYMLFFLIGFLISIIIWINIAGLKDYYPYLYQFSEID